MFDMRAFRNIIFYLKYEEARFRWLHLYKYAAINPFFTFVVRWPPQIQKEATGICGDK